MVSLGTLELFMASHDTWNKIHILHFDLRALVWALWANCQASSSTTLHLASTPSTPFLQLLVWLAIICFLFPLKSNDCHRSWFSHHAPFPHSTPLHFQLLLPGTHQPPPLPALFPVAASSALRSQLNVTFFANPSPATLSKIALPHQWFYISASSLFPT